MNITKLNKPFVAQTVLTAAQLNSITDTVDLIIDNWPTVTPPDDSGEDIPDDILDDINAAKLWITGKIADIQALISQFDGNAHYRTDQELLDLFKGEMGKALLVHYGICDADGHPFFNVLLDENGVKPAAIIGAITDQNGNLVSQIGISADNVIIDANNTTLTGKLTAIDGVLQNLNVTDTITGKHIVGGDINIGDGTFIVDSNGNVTAESITLNGQGHCIIRLTGQLVTLPDPRPGTIVTIVNETPTSPSILSTDPMIVTKNRSTQFIRYFVANGSGAGSWSRASSASEDSKLPAWIVEQIVYIQLVANGTNWYVTACIMKDGNLWPGDRTL